MKEKNRTEIGEIFKFGGIWWQKVRHDDYPSDEDECVALRSTMARNYGLVKLKKVGQPICKHGIMLQSYKIYTYPFYLPDKPYMFYNGVTGLLEIEIEDENMKKRKYSE